MRVKWSFENGSTQLALSPENSRERAIVNLFMSEKGNLTCRVTVDDKSNLNIEPEKE